MKKFAFCPACRHALVNRVEDHNRYRLCPQCGEKYFTNPLPSAVAFVRNPNGELLVIKRGVEPGRGRWALPSGFIEENERPEQTVVRELREETGIRGRIRRLIGVYTEPTVLYGYVLLIAYELDGIGGRLKAGSDTTNARFVPVDRLPEIPFAGHRAIIRDGLGRPPDAEARIEVLRSKITEVTITKTVLFYNGSIGIDGAIMDRAHLCEGEKVHVLNYDNGERFITYTIRERSGSGAVILYGPAAHKGKRGDRICVLSYAQVPLDQARDFQPTVIAPHKKNRVRR